MLVKVPTQALALLALSGLLYSANADLQITNPIDGTEWASGKTVRITWTKSGKTAKRTDIWLQHGDAQHLNRGIPIREGANVDDLSVEWKVPDVYTRDDYTVRIGTDLPNDDVNYSHFFKIEGKGAPPNDEEEDEGTKTIPKKTASDETDASEEEEGSGDSEESDGSKAADDTNSTDSGSSAASGGDSAGSANGANSGNSASGSGDEIKNGASGIVSSRISAFAGAAIVVVAMMFC